MATRIRPHELDAVLRHLTVEEYLLLEEGSPVRHEYVGGERFALAGGSPEHGFIAASVTTAFHLAARGGPCRIGNSDVLVQIAPDIYYYPDVSVICDPDGYGPRFATRPCVVVEVLSPSTAATDRREKRLAYRRVESIKALLIVYQDKALVECHTQDDAGTWNYEEVGLGGVIRVPCPVADIPIEEFYPQIPHLLVPPQDND